MAAVCLNREPVLVPPNIDPVLGRDLSVQSRDSP
jgi:hypothetical protein